MNTMQSLQPTPQELRELLRYEPETGKLFWLPRPREMFRHERSFAAFHTNFANKEAFTSSMGKAGYRRGAIKDRLFLAHRVIWAIVHGEWPAGQVDHINHDRQDNRIENLRVVSHVENQRNRSMMPHNSSGVNGISWHVQRRKWQVRVGVHGRSHYVGVFSELSDATSARIAAERELGFHPNHGSAR